MNLLKYINDKTNNAYENFKLISVIFDKKANECVFKFLYKDNITDDNKQELQSIISEYLKANTNVIVKCRKAYVDCDLVKDILYNFVSRNYGSVCVDFSKENIYVDINDEISVKIVCNKFQYDYLSAPSIYQEITEYVGNVFFESFTLKFVEEGDLKVQLDELPEHIYFDDVTTHLKYTKITDVKKYIGEVVGTPINIGQIKGAMESVEIAGVVKFLTKKSFMSKRKDKEGNFIEKFYYSFTLVDNSGRFNCVYFPLKSDEAKAFNLKDDDTLVLHGDVEDFNGRINFKVKNIAYCGIVEENEEETVTFVKEPKEKYIYVKPEPYVEVFQDNFFSEKEVIGDYMQNNDIVVFDIETTGLDALNCEILEIGAVKIKNGVISETFESLIKPTVAIPEEITSLTGITDAMVANALTIKQVLPDFYKFCYGTTIIAYNIDFDYKFISVQGKKLGYIFDMKQIDAMYLARAFIPGLKNFKLGSVCKRLGVSLENAHRAVHDAIATAEVVIKLNTHMK